MREDVVRVFLLQFLIDSCLRVNLTTLKEVTREGLLSRLCRSQLVIWKREIYRNWVLFGFQTFPRDNRWSNATLTNGRNLLFLEPIIWTNQETQPTQPIVAWNLWYVFPVLGNRNMFSGASGSIVFPRLAIIVCFPAFCISGLCVFAALDIISFSYPRHRFELQLSYLRFLWIIRCDYLRWFSLTWTLPNFPGDRKYVRRRFKKTFSKWRCLQCWWTLSNLPPFCVM